MLEAGFGIGIGAERQPFALEQAHHFALGHVGAAVERHVFDKVGIAAFVRIAINPFVERSGRNFHPHFGGAGGGGVAAHDIAHAVGQLAEAVAGIYGQIAFFKGPARMICDRAGGWQLDTRSAGASSEQDRAKRGDKDTGTHCACYRALWLNRQWRCSPQMLGPCKKVTPPVPDGAGGVAVGQLRLFRMHQVRWGCRCRSGHRNPRRRCRNTCRRTRRWCRQ